MQGRLSGHQSPLMRGCSSTSPLFACAVAGTPTSAMGLSASDIGSVAAACISFLAMVVTILIVVYDRHVRRQEASAAAAAGQQALLDELEREYINCVQPKMAQLGLIKGEYPDGLLWAKLTGQQPAGVAPVAGAAPASELEAQQLQAGRMKLLLNVAAASQAAKGWWIRFHAAVCSDQLPPGFGKPADVAGAAVDLIEHNKRAKESGKGGEKWRFRSNNFRELVEPYDIADYYSVGLHKTPSGVVHYLQNRPGIFRDLEAIETAPRHAAQLAAAQQPPKARTYKSSLVWAVKAKEAFDADPATAGPPALPADLAPLEEQQV